MKTLAIIAEYNPFHNGHLHHLMESKDVTGANHSITIMSGNFLERGQAALLDKYTRALMCVDAGMDLALELPFPYATGSALDFSMGGVSILNKLNSVDYLCFGAETPDLNMFYKVVDVTLEEPDAYKNVLKDYLAKGFSYPLARSRALDEYFKDSSLGEFVSSPNNILGIEYISALKRLKSNIIPVPIPRVNAGYHDPKLYGNISSATAIRTSIEDNKDNPLSFIKDDIPKTTYDILTSSFGSKWPVYTDYLTPFLQGALLAYDDYSHICDINKDLSNKISKLPPNISFNQAVDMLKSKEVTQTRINRCLIHLIMGYTEDMRKNFIQQDYGLYANILGFRRDSSGLIKDISQNSIIPLINKKADFLQSINGYNIDLDTAKLMWKLDTKATDLYNCLLYNNLGFTNTNDYTTRIPIV